MVYGVCVVGEAGELAESSRYPVFEPRVPTGLRLARDLATHETTSHPKLVAAAAPRVPCASCATRTSVCVSPPGSAAPLTTGSVETNNGWQNITKRFFGNLLLKLILLLMDGRYSVDSS